MCFKTEKKLNNLMRNYKNVISQSEESRIFEHVILFSFQIITVKSIPTVCAQEASSFHITSTVIVKAQIINHFEMCSDVSEAQTQFLVKETLMCKIVPADLETLSCVISENSI